MPSLNTRPHRSVLDHTAVYVWRGRSWPIELATEAVTTPPDTPSCRGPTKRCITLIPGMGHPKTSLGTGADLVPAGAPGRGVGRAWGNGHVGGAPPTAPKEHQEARRERTPGHGRPYSRYARVISCVGTSPVEYGG